MDLHEVIRPIWMYYYRMIQSNNDILDSSLTFPLVPQTHIELLMKETANILYNEPSLLRIIGDVVVIGAIHGHILDLFRIIKQFGSPEYTKYLFLGNFIDYGDFSTETAILIFVLKYLYPNNVFIIRGKHEFAHICQRGTFSSELYAIYGNKMIQSAFLKAFAYLPFASLVNNKILCVHGGIGPNSNDISTIESIKRPIYDSESIVAKELIFSEPSDSISQSIKSRNYLYTFGQKAVQAFMKNEKIDLIIRCKEIIEGGIEYGFNNSIASVCSASNFCGIYKNNSCVIKIKSNGQNEQVILPPIAYVKRMKAVHLSRRISNISSYPNTVPSVSGPVTTSRSCPNSNVSLVSSLKSSTKLPVLSSRIKECSNMSQKNVENSIIPNRKSMYGQKNIGEVNHTFGMKKDFEFLGLKKIMPSRLPGSKRSPSVWK